MYAPGHLVVLGEKSCHNLWILGQVTPTLNDLPTLLFVFCTTGAAIQGSVKFLPILSQMTLLWLDFSKCLVKNNEVREVSFPM